MQSGVQTNSDRLPETRMPDKLYIGADVSKGWIDVAIYGQPATLRVRQDRDAISAWLASLDPASVGLVAFEPTGGYERLLRRCLRDAGLAVARVHPNQIVAFRARRGVRAKTDRIDARLLAEFAALELSHRGLAPLLASDDGLRALAARRRQLVALLQAERCRSELAEPGPVRNSLEQVIAVLTAQLDLIEAAIDAAIAANEQMVVMAALLRSFKCVGRVTVFTLLAGLPELGLFSGKEIAALVGLAPFQRDSGKRRGRARTGYGRPEVREVLFNVARSAIQHNPRMREFYQRLVTANRRPGKVALTAVMRKVLVSLNAIARTREPWKGAVAA